ncbi:hypothetical protein N184_00415 [Sinorhizobium sp. GL28]|nr:hypothetical protein N184_00415 [Sinorhizobium sp. GL28]
MLEIPSKIRLPRAPRAVLFDMDELLFDTEALARDAMMRTAPDFGYEMPASLYLDTIGLPGDATRSVLRHSALLRRSYRHRIAKSRHKQRNVYQFRRLSVDVPSIARHG